MSRDESDSASPKHVLLTGPPGIGKTTLVRKTCEELRKKEMNLRGFYTEEVRKDGKRVGFDVVTLGGERGVLARIMDQLPGGQKYPSVGQYGVDVRSFESLAHSQIQPQGAEVLVIDEIGKMELFSSAFQNEVRKAFHSSSCPILATIPVPKGPPIRLVKELTERPDVTVIPVYRSNRDQLLDKIMGSLLNK